MGGGRRSERAIGGGRELDWDEDCPLTLTLSPADGGEGMAKTKRRGGARPRPLFRLSSRGVFDEGSRADRLLPVIPRSLRRGIPN